MDVDANGEGQLQAFRLVCGFETELGYVDIPDLLEAGVELGESGSGSLAISNSPLAVIPLAALSLRVTGEF